MTRNFTEWTSAEIRTLRDNAHLGIDVLVELLNRPRSSIKMQAHRMRISLRRKGSRRGLLLGQPRSTRWSDLRTTGISEAVLKAIKEETLDGKIDLAELEQAIIAVRDGDEPPLCPMCTVRPIAHVTGICQVCHFKELARQHRIKRDIAEAQRDLWSARQDSSRKSRQAKRVKNDNPTT